jgi:N-methylhydantoinase A
VLQHRRLGIDVGGTFTDFALVNDEDGSVATYKQLTTPADPSECVLAGIDQLLGREGVTLADVRVVAHGTTLITNSVIERKGAKTAMLVTDGFLDVLDVGMESRYDLFDLRIEYADPVVPRRLRRGIPERLRHDGSVQLSLDEQAVKDAARSLVEDHACEALAVCFLHAYVNPAHEQRAAAIVAELYPDFPISTSSDVVPVMREFERWSTTTINAYTQPLAARYLGRIERALAERGFGGAFLIMTSSGGAVTVSEAQRWPVRLIESGPAAGALMAAVVGKSAGHSEVLSFDMGGTTAKGAIVRGGQPLKRYRLEVAREHEFKVGSGLPLLIPVIDMIEIGAGGGSLASVDKRGLLEVGPLSAGADPGPACYGRGGEAPTLTDANTVLGYLVPEQFLGGEMPLDRRLAERALTQTIAEPLGIDAARAAWGTHEVINEAVARAFRMHASELGFDYRHCSMVAFGGSGPVHALRVARKLGIPRVIFPPAAGVMSAVGLLVSPLSFEAVRSERVAISEVDTSILTGGFTALSRQALDFLASAGIGEAEVSMHRRLDMRYAGQGYDIEVELPPGPIDESMVARIPSLFNERYARVFSDVTLSQPIEIVNWKVEASGPKPAIGADYGASFFEGGPAHLGTQNIYSPEAREFEAWPIIARYALAPGSTLDGPALLQERESTCVIGPGERVRIDEAYNVIAELIPVGRTPEGTASV